MGAKEAAWVRQSSGLYELSSDALPVSAADVSALTKKLVRGLHFAIFTAPLGRDIRIDTYVVGEEAWPKLLDQVRSMTPQGTPPGFIFWRGASDQHPDFAFWYFLVWGQVFLQASTIPPDVSQSVT